MITFKENTFVKGNYDELMEMGKAIEEKGAEVCCKENKDSNHLWWCNLNKRWSLYSDLEKLCDHELTKSQLYEAYGIVDFSILNENDVFYIETNFGKYLYQGKNPLVEGKRVSVSLNNNFVFPLGIGLIQYDKNEYKLIRLATTEEIEPYKEHFKLNNMETRPIQISQEIATRWYNGEDNELKQLAIQTFPELDEATPKVGDLCLFSNDKNRLNLGFGVVGIYNGKNGDYLHKCDNWGSTFMHCKKIKSIEFY